MRPWSSLHAPRRTCLAALIAALVVSSCGGASTGNARALSEADYLVVAKRVCLDARQAAKHASVSASPPLLRRSAEAAESPDISGTCTAARSRLAPRNGACPMRIRADSTARPGAEWLDDDDETLLSSSYRQLLRRSNELAHELGYRLANDTSAP